MKKKYIIIAIAILFIICAGIIFINYSNNGFVDLEWVSVGNRIYKIENGKNNSKNANKILRNSKKGEYLVTLNGNDYSSATNNYTGAKIYKLEGFNNEVELLLEHNDKKRLLTLARINDKVTMKEILNMYGSISDIKYIKLKYCYTDGKKQIKRKISNNNQIQELYNLLEAVPISEEPIYTQIPESAFTNQDSQDVKEELSDVYIEIYYNNYTCLTLNVTFLYNTNAISTLGMLNSFILTEELSNYLQNNI